MLVPRDNDHHGQETNYKIGMSGLSVRSCELQCLTRRYFRGASVWSPGDRSDQITMVVESVLYLTSYTIQQGLRYIRERPLPSEI